ncbi:hydrolase, NUDIX family protein [Coccidioides posadasii C735 delta SOWgp]|uniref:Hydrolase, NUDIX family protein n=1 Tax=Coccidioides posadasii (strain C735) TaxID=222929 RepID=C5PI79_COCP7|nr:hydrolase, NUDIX family protein [Coccidioides posadasii C735 delta SOWgp]EER24232.1 hydrolase, NUDIX family protein [Coccidioides posadasii C735 delta SOWgp]|eukprot:XP_003066377.1 hydrolase, NUDIX family protein [Coccidioides posadasii C735 delta SOWgp]
MSKSYLDLVNECDRFPYCHDDPVFYEQYITNYHTFKISGCSAGLGYIPNFVVDKFPWPKDLWEINHETRTVTLLAPHDAAAEQRTDLLARTLAAAVKEDTFQVLRGWRNELYPIYGPGKKLLGSIERSGSNLFGILTYGVHMTVYVNDENGIRIWVARRSKTKQTYPGMLDNTVGGGISTGEQPFESLVREAIEEASLPEDLVRANTKAVGCVTYTYIRDARAGGETGLLQPECEYVYDLEVDSSVVPKPCDTEVEGFYLWTVDEVKAALANGEFKPNCSVVLIDFFIRHNIITQENEKDYLEIQARIHRRHEVPTL